MKFKTARGQTVVSALLVSLLLMACGEKPETMLSSAKDYLAKDDAKSAVIQIKNALQSNPNLPEARYLLGTALLDSGDAAGAEMELRKALELKHPTEQVLPQMAKAMLLQGHAKKLTDEWGKTDVPTAAAKADFQTTLSSAWAAQGLTEPSQQALDAALAAVPGYGPARIAQARQKAAQRDFDGALALVDEVIAATPRNLDAWKLKGDLQRYGKNQPAQALQAYLKTVEIKPDYLQGHVAVIGMLQQQGQFPEAEKQLELVKKFAPNHPQTKFLEAQMAMQKKDPKLAQELVQQVLKSSPTNVQALQLAGVVEFSLNSMQQAEGYLGKALQSAPELPLARRLLVLTYLRTGQPTKALATLQPGLSREPVDPELLAVAGEVYLQNGDVKKAEDYFSQASKLDPKNAKNRTSLAMTHLMEGQVDSAVGELQNIAASDSGMTADMALISVHLRQQEFDKALVAIDALEKKQPDKPLAANLRGRTLLAKRDLIGARKSFERALVIDPNFFPAVASLAGLDMVEKKPEDAKKRLEAVIVKEPKNGQALLALAELAARAGAPNGEVAKLIGNAVTANPTEAAPHLVLIDFYLHNREFKLASSAAQSAVAALPDSTEVLDALGRTQQAAGELNQAIATYNKLVGLQPMSAMAQVRLAEVYMAAKDKDGAAKSLRRALVINPDMQQAQRAMILLDMDGKNVEGALLTARTMQKQKPKDSSGYLMEGDINASQKNWVAAAAAYRNGLAQVGSPDLAIKLHAVLQASGKSAEADKFAAGWQKSNPKDAAFALYQGDAAIARKDYAAAEKFYMAVIQLQPNNAAAYNNLAWATAKLNKDGAIVLAERANALDPRQPAFMDTLAMLLSEKGDYAKAQDLQTRALALQPQNSQFKLNLAKIHLKGGNKELAKKELDDLVKLGDKFAGQAELAALLKRL